MIVATRAGQRQPEESAPGHIDLVIDDIRHHFLFVRLALLPAANG